MFGQAINVQNFSGGTGVLMLDNSIVSGHTGATTDPSGAQNTSATAINVFQNNTATLTNNLFFDNTNDTDQGVGDGSPPGTYVVLEAYAPLSNGVMSVSEE